MSQNKNKKNKKKRKEPNGGLPDGAVRKSARIEVCRTMYPHYIYFSDPRNSDVPGAHYHLARKGLLWIHIHIY